MLPADPLHPQMQALADAISAGPPLSSLTPVEARAAMAALEPMLGQGEPIARRQTLAIPSRHGSIPATLLSPAESRGLIVYLHGGGWVLGTLAHVEAAGRRLANASGCAVLLIEYRLAPEHPFPAAIEDSRTALSWTADHLNELVGSPVPLMVGGDSAGGNLAALVSAWTRDRGGPDIAAQLLIYPVTDANFETESYVRFAADPILDRPAMEWFWRHYLPDTARRRSPDVAPLRASSFAGLPPTILVTAGNDPLSSEGEAYGLALSAAGVRVIARHYPDMAHGFATMPALIDAARAALTFAGEQLAGLIAAKPEVADVCA